MRLKTGRGYVSADKNFDEDLALGYIPIDSVHSPVRKVNFTVEAARLGQMTDYDKLTLEVWTNGAVSPQDAIGYAAKLLKDHMTIFINFEEVPEQTEEISERGIDKMNEVLNRSVEELELQRSLLQLPEERQHPDHRRTGAEDRSRNAAHQEFRPQVAQRNQGNSGQHGPRRSACGSTRTAAWSRRRSRPPGMRSRITARTTRAQQDQIGE